MTAMARDALPIQAGLLAVVVLGLPLAPDARAQAGQAPSSHSPSHSEANLQVRAERLGTRYRARLGQDYEAQIDARRHLVYVSALDAKALRTVRQVLATQLAAHRQTLFPQPLARNVVVVLPTAQDYRRLVGRSKALGRYSTRERCLVTMTLGSVLRHEFTHAVHHNDQQRAGQEHAVWVAEALATLYQYADIQDGRLAGRRTGDLAPLQRAVREGKAVAFKDLVRMDSAAFLQRADVTYPQVRWLALWLQERDQLGAFYERYKDTYGDDPSGAQALEAVFGSPLADVETEWRRWLRKQEPPWRPRWEAVAHLGIRMRAREHGVAVDGFLPGSSAARSKQFRVGDVILSVAGEPTPDPAELAKAVQSCKPGQTVRLEVLRDGRMTVVPHVLGAVRHVDEETKAPEAPSSPAPPPQP